MARSVLQVKPLYSQHTQHTLGEFGSGLPVKDYAHVQGKACGVLPAEGGDLRIVYVGFYFGVNFDTI